MSEINVLVVEDDNATRYTIRAVLEKHGYVVVEADSVREAEHAVEVGRPDVAVIDFELPDGNALDLLPRLKRLDPQIPVVIVTAHGSIDLAVRAIKEGAENFLTKPVELQALLVLIDRLIEQRRNLRGQAAHKTRQDRSAVDPFLGTGRAVRQLRESVERLLSTTSPILISGETGAGKGVLAAWIHRHGLRAREPFVDLNCAGLSREFLESELFGHRKGAFTGAVANKTGLLDVAHRGTVFLDEIGDMDLDVQAKILKVVEEKKFRVLGGVQDRRVDIQLIAASHRNLSQMLGEGTFRLDLYYRLSTIPITIPPLRERVEDIPALARYLVARIVTELGRNEMTLLSSALTSLQEYSWPGNLRELRNVLERAVLLSHGDSIGRQDLQFDPTVDASASILERNLTLVEAERLLIERTLERVRGSVADAAQRLGIPKSSLYQKIKKHGLEIRKS